LQGLGLTARTDALVWV